MATHKLTYRELNDVLEEWSEDGFEIDAMIEQLVWEYDYERDKARRIVMAWAAEQDE